MTAWQAREQQAWQAALARSSLTTEQQEFLQQAMHDGYAAWAKHGDAERWQQAWQAQGALSPSSVELDADSVRIGSAQDVSEAERVVLRDALQALHPWRKGPFSVFGLAIDTEWHSDWKWQRVAPHLAPLAGRRVLDVGCGSGYHLWCMLGADAELVVGIDPTLLFAMQFEAVKRYMPEQQAFFLPVGVEAFPQDMAAFDTVFSMGILYHRRSPIDHLTHLKSLLRPGGELVLETLCIADEDGQCLLPQGRYAKMRNVWFIPNVAMLETMLQRAGFRHTRCVHAAVTPLDEQRATDWMRFESLRDFLHPDDTSKTIEGYPAPRRVVLIAEA